MTSAAVPSSSGRIVLDVPSLTDGVQFYTSKPFPFHLHKLHAGGFAELVAEDNRLRLDLAEMPAGTTYPVPLMPSIRRSYERHWTPLHLDIVVPDLPFAVQQATAIGAKIEGNQKDECWGSMVNLSDPFGHGFCLIVLNGLGYDELDRQPERKEQGDYPRNIKSDR